MKKSEVDKLNIQKPEGVFTPKYSYSECLAIKNEDGEVIDYEYTDFVLNKTSEEVYQDYLNPLPPEPTAEEMIIAEMSMSMAQMQIENSQAIAELTTALAMMQIPLV